MHSIDVGTAGWSIPRTIAQDFPAEGTGLERYATRFRIAEINSSFHRQHRPSTWERWRDSVPDDFRFAVKLPKEITHRLQLIDCSEPLQAFLEDAHILAEKLGALLVQLPPKCAFGAEVAGSFLTELKGRSPVRVACEPRHPSWFTPDADALLRKLEVSRVAADPAICPEAALPGGWPDFSYWRLHGSPVIYRSSYQDRIETLAEQLRASAGGPAWCIFDNTASSAGASDALALVRALAR